MNKYSWKEQLNFLVELWYLTQEEVNKALCQATAKEILKILETILLSDEW